MYILRSQQYTETKIMIEDFKIYVPLKYKG